jgi:hypothetical protein
MNCTDIPDTLCELHSSGATSAGGPNGESGYLIRIIECTGPQQRRRGHHLVLTDPGTKKEVICGDGNKAKDLRASALELLGDFAKAELAFKTMQDCDNSTCCEGDSK